MDRKDMPHALNLKESGADVVVGPKKNQQKLGKS